MISIGWSEVIICALIALIILGPERLARFLFLLGKFIRLSKRTINAVSLDLEQSVKKDDAPSSTNSDSQGKG